MVRWNRWSLALALCVAFAGVTAHTAAGAPLRAEEQEEAKDTSSFGALETSPLFWAATVVVFAIGVVLCADSSGDPVTNGQRPEVYSDPQGQIRHNTAYDASTRPAIPTPHSATRPPVATPANTVDPTQVRRPTPQGVFVDQSPAKILECFFVKIGTEYKQVTEAEAAQYLSQGHQVFTQPDRSQAGVDIYEALPNSHDLYSVVNRPTDGFDPDNLYSTPSKVPGRQSAPAAAPSAARPPLPPQPTTPVPQVPASYPPPSKSVPLDYEDPDNLNALVPSAEDVRFFGSADVAQWVKQKTLNRDACVQLLTPHPPGTYLLRSRENGSYALALQTDEKVCHYKIEFTGNNQVFINHGAAADAVTFGSVADLISYYRSHNYNQRGGLGHNLVQCLPFTR